jgi:very-short-patch-repair endonuclease
MKNEAEELKRIKRDIISSYEDIFDDLIDICGSPIERIFFANILKYFFNQTKSPMGFGFFQPIYDYDFEIHNLKCFGVEILGSDESDWKATKSSVKRINSTRLSIKIFPQEKLEVLGNIYFLDFGIYVSNLFNPDLPDLKIAIECDGHEFHSSKESIRKDNARMRNASSDGWHFIRFSGSEINGFNENDFQNEMGKIIFLINSHFNLEKFSNFSMFNNVKTKGNTQ